MVDNDKEFEFAHPTKPNPSFEEIRDFIARVDDGHITPDEALYLIIETIAINDPGYFAQTCLDVGAKVPCDCAENYW